MIRFLLFYTCQAAYRKSQITKKTAPDKILRDSLKRKNIFYLYSLKTVKT
jgi:hypothetical protein